jgi:Tol biopolymer transport system component
MMTLTGMQTSAYYCDDENKKAYTGNGKPDIGKLLVLNIKTGNLRTLFEDPGGTIRDPCVHYDGKKILFSWRKNNKDNFNLYEINTDGTGLRQITYDNYDDYESIYLPNDDIVFVSTRCKRWVNCWMTQVGIIYRCDSNGKNIKAISSNTEHDNTPWIMPDGRILYTRWEYVDRSQVEFHHLWIMNPDGTGQMIYYGNIASKYCYD